MIFPICCFQKCPIAGVVPSRSLLLQGLSQLLVQGFSCLFFPNFAKSAFAGMLFHSVDMCTSRARRMLPPLKKKEKNGLV